jgi:hypothetical protein
MNARFGRLHRIVLVMNGRSGTSEVVNLIDFDIQREGDVVPEQLEMRMTGQVFYISARSGKEIVDAENGRSVRQQALAKVRSDEAGTASNQYARFKMHVRSLERRNFFIW